MIWLYFLDVFTPVGDGEPSPEELMRMAVVEAERRGYKPAEVCYAAGVAEVLTEEGLAVKLISGIDPQATLMQYYSKTPLCVKVRDKFVGTHRDVKCPYCGSENVEAVKTWKMPRQGYDVTHYRCRDCGGLFNHYVGRGKEFVLRVGARRGKAGKQ
ncbi:MAG: hypothetical protein QXP98_00505 [Thermoproteus sp.]